MKCQKFNLQLFAEGGEGGAAAPGAPGAGEAASNGISNQAQTVVYGKQTAAQTVPQPEGGVGNPTGNEPTNAEGEQGKETQPLSFKDLLKANPNYKQDVEALVQSRLKNSNIKVSQLEQKFNSQNDLLLKMYSRYNVQEGDTQGLEMAFARDTSYLQEEADMRGITVEQLSYMKQMEANNMIMQRQQRQSQEMQMIQLQQQKWNMEAQQCKLEYPDFDFSYELNNPDFEQLIRSGVPMKDAYKFVHMNEIMQNQVTQTAKDVEQQVTSSVKNKQSRPTENAATNFKPGAVVKDDVNNLSKKDLAEIRRRVENGEEISF